MIFAAHYADASDESFSGRGYVPVSKSYIFVSGTLEGERLSCEDRKLKFISRNDISGLSGLARGMLNVDGDHNSKSGWNFLTHV